MRGGHELRRLWSHLNWPNRISLMRLLLVPPFLVLMNHHQGHDSYRYVALAIFAVMAISDFLDGQLARRMHAVSRLGAFLDPLADKILIVCSAVLLSLPGSAVEGVALPDWVVIMIVGKDLFVVVGFVLVFMVTGHTRIRPTRAGKLCTLGQLVMVVAVLIAPEINGWVGSDAGTWTARVLWCGVAGLCVLAMLAYLRMGIASVAEQDHGAANGSDSSARK